MPPVYTTLSRLDIGVMSLIAALRVSVPWGAVAAESLEGADPVTPMGKANRAYREERGLVDGRA